MSTDNLARKNSPAGRRPTEGNRSEPSTPPAPSSAAERPTPQPEVISPLGAGSEALRAGLRWGYGQRWPSHSAQKWIDPADEAIEAQRRENPLFDQLYGAGRK